MFSLKKTLRSTCCLLIAALLIFILHAPVFAEETDELQFAATEEIQQQTKLYLKPNGNWKTDDAWFALYYFDFNDHYDCVVMTDEDGDGVFEAMLPEGYPNFLFYRMDAATLTFDGDYVLHQTDCFEYSENTQCYALTEDSWEAGNWEPAPIIADATTDGAEVSTSDETVFPKTTVKDSEMDTDESSKEAETSDTTETTVSENNSNTEESTSTVLETESAETIVSESETNIEDPTSEILADNTEELDTQIETKIFYLSLDQVDQEYNWKIVTLKEEYDVTIETEKIYSVELPVDTETIILRGDREENFVISSEEILLADLQDNNCIVAFPFEEDVNKFEIVWGIYNPETEEIDFVEKENLVIEETIPSTETVLISENEATEEIVVDETQDSEENYSEELMPSESTVDNS